MRDYDKDRAERDGIERTFTLAGRTFTAKPAMPARSYSALVDFDAELAQTGLLPRGSFETIADAIRSSLVEESRQAFDELLNADLANPITLTELNLIALDLMSEAAGRPTEQLSPSGDTDESTNEPSTAKSVSAEERVSA